MVPVMWICHRSVVKENLYYDEVVLWESKYCGKKYGINHYHKQKYKISEIVWENGNIFPKSDMEFQFLY